MIKRSAAARECDSSGRRLRTYLLKDWRTFAQLFQADGRCAKSCLLKGGTFPFISCFLVPERQAAISPSFAWRLHPRTKKARKGNVGTSVEWRLNSENDSRLHPRTKKARKGNVGTSVEWRLNSENDSRLHPRTKKARKGNVGTSVEWRLNSENDSRLHGQPSFTIRDSFLWF